MFVPPRGPRYSQDEAVAAIAASRSWAETLRRLGMCESGGGGRVLQKYARIWGISTDHFDPYAAARHRTQRPLSEVLIEGSTYSRSNLKPRLYASGLKDRRCEICGQGETWHGRRMSLILDHVNGVSHDNRIENLRIVCPNCAATLDTHCGRNARFDREDRDCLHCGRSFTPKYLRHRYCSPACGSRWDRTGIVLAGARRAERPPIDELLAMIAEEGYEAVGRRFGVSGNAIRKWVRAAGAPLPPGKRPVPPVRRALDDDGAREALRLLGEGMTQREVAARLGVNRWVIKDLSRRRRYTHLARDAGTEAA
jgi:hypothetical protein